MEHTGSLQFKRSGDAGYAVTFTANPQSGGESVERILVNEGEFGEFLLDAGFGAQHSDGIQGAIHSIGHHTADVHFSDKQFRRLFPRAAAAVR